MAHLGERPSDVTPFGFPAHGSPGLATIAGILLLALYYLSTPPFPAYVYSKPAEGSYLIVNKVLIELAALWVLFLFPTSQTLGLDRLLGRKAAPEASHD